MSPRLQIIVDRRPFVLAAALWAAGGVPLLASTDGGPTSDLWAMLEFGLAVGGILIGAGATLQQVVQLHKAVGDERAARLAAEAEHAKTYARLDVVTVQHNALLEGLQRMRDSVEGLNDRLETFFPNLNVTLTGGEARINAQERAIAVLQAESQLKGRA